jgi:hypothetical protein
VNQSPSSDVCGRASAESDAGPGTAAVQYLKLRLTVTRRSHVHVADDKGPAVGKDRWSVDGITAMILMN